MDDGPNRGQPTDRIEVVWDLTSTSTLDCQLLATSGRSADARPGVDAAGTAALLSVGAAGEPVSAAHPGPQLQHAIIGIPADIERLRISDPALALRWRYALRRVLALLLADKSWQVTGFTRSGGYLLDRSAPPANEEPS
jgi:predicted GNAT superfamily acetyltransferase